MNVVPNTRNLFGGQVPADLAGLLNNDTRAISTLYQAPSVYAHPLVVRVVQKQLKGLGYAVEVNGELDDATAHGLRDTFGLEWELVKWYDLIWHLYPHVGFGMVDVGGSIALSAIAAGIMFFFFRGKI